MNVLGVSIFRFENDLVLADELVPGDENLVPFFHGEALLAPLPDWFNRAHVEKIVFDLLIISWIRLYWIGLLLDWIGLLLDWIGFLLDWIGLDWIGLDYRWIIAQRK